MKSYHIITFGCQMNEHDSERMAGILEAQGFVPAASVEDAGMVILNTCSIREKAEQKFYSELGRLSHLKGREGKELTIAVAGCIAQQEGKRLLSRTTPVDLVVGPSDIARLSDMVAEHREGKTAVVETSGDPGYHQKPVPAVRADGLKAWVSIMYGCDNFCTYCVVPYLRGRERSRPSRDIAAEVRSLAERGFREVTLLGQNVNSYGKGSPDPTSFPELLRMLQEIDGIFRIRFVTSHPRDLSDELMRVIGTLPKVCEAIHLPVQSGSDRILAAMNRNYTAAGYREKVKELRDAAPGVTITTDIIAGFPGETDDDAEQTLQLLSEVEFDNIFAFKYSKRPGTKALDLPGHLPEQVKEDRLGRILELQRHITLRKNAELVGSFQEVLVEGMSKKGGTLTGRTRGNKAVNFPGSESLRGSLVTARITSAGQNSLAGDLCG